MDDLIIIIDSRETIPYKFKGYPVIFQALPWGDYSVKGYEDKISVESKNQMEFYTWIGAHRERAIEQLEAMAKYDCSAVIVESTLEQLLHPEHTGRTRMTANHVMGFITKIVVDYRIPILFSGTWKNGESLTFSILEKYHKELRDGKRTAKGN